MIIDLYSRKITGYEVHEAQSGDLAASLMQRTVLREGGWRQPLVLHADNGAAMKSQTLQVKLAELNITPSHSRPRVSNYNAYAESLFRTLKYVPQWPSSGFVALEDAQNWVNKFTQWYNRTVHDDWLGQYLFRSLNELQHSPRTGKGFIITYDRIWHWRMSRRCSIFNVLTDSTYYLR
ncbi:transposase family protein [Rosenbergiella sp. S61]|uniref:Transposase family protein n=1 Tax=Rosenbergiella gaditana TaxID=2726987 RepID=A0ABS5SYB3_9GAMM|nr:transposase family protein [Rosenbergiella gaditana]